MTQYAEVNGYSLFNEVEDKEIQTYNRARVMKNMMLDNSKNGVINEQGKFLVIGYMHNLPMEDRPAIMEKLSELMEQKEIE